MGILGIPAILHIGKELCRLLTKFSPKIVEFSGNDETVITVLATALTACEAMEEVLKTLREQGD